MAGQVDFYSMLSGLGDTIAKQRTEAARKQALAGAIGPDGSVDFQKAMLGFSQIGDVEGAARLAQIAGQAEDRKFRQSTDARDFGFRQQESQRAQQNADRAQSNFDKTHSPDYIREINEAKTKPRGLTVSDIGKLSEEGGKFSQVSGFGDTFKPEFAGYRSQWVGELANTAGRNLPEGVVGKNMAGAANWWQGYDRYKNAIRNDLFGSALTATEKAAFEQADVNPGMDPKMIQQNLARQKAIIEGNIRNKAGAMVEAGYDPAVVGKSYGIDLGKLGIEPKKRGGNSTATDPLQKARDAIARGANREAVIKRLVEAGIKPEGL